MATPPAFDNTLGASFIALVSACTIYGITILQTYSYFLEYPDDRRFLKCFVAFIMLLDTVTMAFLCHSIYWYTVTSFGVYSVLPVPVWSLVIQLPLGSLLAACVQFFFAYRIFIISAKRNRWAPAVIVVLAVTEVVGGIGFAITSFTEHLLFNDTGPGVVWTVLNNGAGLCCDTLIAGAMVFYLRRGRGEFKRTRSALNTLIIYAVNTGVLTTIFALLALVTFVSLVGKLQLIYAPFVLILGRIYTCSFMSTLNARKSIRAQVTASDTTSVVLSDLNRSGPSTNNTGRLAGGRSKGLTFANTQDPLKSAASEMV